MRSVERIEFNEFEWDEVKRLRTLNERGIDFRSAAEALLKPHLEERSDRNEKSGLLRSVAPRYE